MVTYSISAGELSDPYYGFAPESLAAYQADTARHEQIWRFASRIIPPDQQTRIDYFMVYTDGPGDSLGSVRQTDSPFSWVLAIDIQDAGNFPLLTMTIVHELGHLVTLSDDQVIIDLELFDNLFDEELHRRADADCDTFLSYAGCTRVDSYLNAFFQRFWPDLYEEWLEVNARKNFDLYLNGLKQIYQQHPDHFVSPYAVHHPQEDIAESFLHFALFPRPTSSTVAGEKVAFFYEYPELEEMRSAILQNLCILMDEP